MLRSTRERSLTGAKGPLANGPALRGGPYRSGCSAGSVIVAIAAVGRNLGVIDILFGRPAEERTGVGTDQVGRALPEALAAVINPHVIAEEGC